MSYEPPPQRPSFNPPPDPGYAAPDYDQRQAGQPWAQQPYPQQQPPYYPPPQQQYYPPQQQFYPPQQSPKKKRHWVRNTFLGLAGFIVLIVIISVATNGGSNGTPAAGSGAAPANAAPAAPQVAKIGTLVRDGNSSSPSHLSRMPSRLATPRMASVTPRRAGTRSCTSQSPISAASRKPSLTPTSTSSMPADGNTMSARARTWTSMAPATAYFSTTSTQAIRYAGSWHSTCLRG